MKYLNVPLPAALALLLAACVSPQPVSYQRDVYPVLENNCLECHTPPEGRGYIKVQLNMESYETLMQGTIYGPVIVPGDSRHSILSMLVEGRADASMRMPHMREIPLSAHEIDVLRQWIDQGARNN